MKKIPIEKIIDGMVLAEAIAETTGKVLLRKGITLQKHLVSRLSTWEIPFVYVETTIEEEKNILSEEKKKTSIYPSLEVLFEGRLVNSSMKTIYQCVKQFRRTHRA